MEFEYNGNLLEEDRINLVVSEIVNKYSFVSLEKAKQAAMLEGRISCDKTKSDELNRLYNIMLVNSDNREVVLPIYRDFLNVLQNNYNDTDDEKYISLAEEIGAYLLGNVDFPLIEN